MKKIFCIFISLITFSVGVFSYFVRPMISPVSLCEVTQNAEIYQFNEIWIRANLDVGIDGGFLNVFELKKGCIDAGADLQFVGYEEELPKEKLGKEFVELIDNLKNQSSENLRAVAGVEIKGKLRKREMNCFAPSFYIEVETIEQVSPIKIIDISEEFKKFEVEK